MEHPVRAYLFLKKIPPYAALLDPMRLLILGIFQKNKHIGSIFHYFGPF